MRHWIAALGATVLMLAQGMACAQDFSHHSFEQVLKAHVSDGQVDYPGIAGDPRFAGYLRDIAEYDPAQLKSDRARLAFWINAYNALAIEGILNGLSPRTLIGKYRYFKSAQYRVAGRDIDLYALEHDIILKLGEPRVHFALVCASASCPKLASEAYTADRLEPQLDQRARLFVQDPTRNRFDSERKIAQLSKIFHWFEDDFESRGGVLVYLSQFMDNPALKSSLQAGGWKIRYLGYDWSLNGVAPPKR